MSQWCQTKHGFACWQSYDPSCSISSLIWSVNMAIVLVVNSPCIMYVQYIGGCSVHRGDTMSTMSTLGGYHEYIGGISWVHRGCSVPRRDTMSTSGGVQYIGGIPWVHLGISWVHRRMFSTSGGYHDTCGGIPWVHGGMFSTSGGYHEYIGGISWVHRGMFSTSEFSIEIERILSSCFPACIMISLRCTEHPPMYSSYPPDVLMVSLRCTEHPPMYWTHIIQGEIAAAWGENVISLSGPLWVSICSQVFLLEIRSFSRNATEFESFQNVMFKEPHWTVSE